MYLLYLQNVYYHSHRNPNLISIVPVEEPAPFQQTQIICPIKKVERESIESHSQGKFIIIIISFYVKYDRTYG